MVPKNFLGISIDKFSFSLCDLSDELSKKIPQKKSLVISTVNLHALSIMRKDRDFYKVYEDADKIIFDGISAIWLAHLSGIKKVERIGTDFLMKLLYELGQKNNWSFYFLGGPKGIAKKAADRIKENFPKIKIIGSYHGYFDEREEIEIKREINTLSPNILVVGLGMPYEGKWINKNRKNLKVGMITNCGAYFEQTANKGINYYPNWAYRYNLNWFYRILKYPKRFWKRYLFESLQFISWIPRFLFGKDSLFK